MNQATVCCNNDHTKWNKNAGIKNRIVVIIPTDKYGLLAIDDSLTRKFFNEVALFNTLNNHNEIEKAQTHTEVNKLDTNSIPSGKLYNISKLPLISSYFPLPMG